MFDQVVNRVVVDGAILTGGAYFIYSGSGLPWSQVYLCSIGLYLVLTASRR